MTKLLNLIDVPALPNDVLRLVFEEATRQDTRKAVKYTLISKLVRDWYAVITSFTLCLLTDDTPTPQG